MHRRLWKVGFAVAILLALVAAAGGLWLRAQIRGSLPVLAGDLRLEGLSAPVIITRDALGIPTVRIIGGKYQDRAPGAYIPSVPSIMVNGTQR